MFAEKKMIRNMRIAMLSLLGATASTWVFADALVISNMAVGEYKEEGSTVVQVARSNLVQTTVIPVYNLSLKDNRTEYVRPGQAVYYHHVLTNTGNERDLYNLLGSQIAGGSFTHSNIEIYFDADRNGVADNNTPISQYSLNAGETVALIIKAIIPSSAAVNSSSQIQLTATSTQQPSLTQNNIDTSRITDQAVLNLTKSFDKTSVVNGDIATVRLTYFNNGNNSGVVNISDLLDTTQLTYVTGNENWNGQALNAATGSNDPTGINYYLDTDGKTIRAQITNVPANAQGYIEFHVRVARTAPGEIPNFANMDYDHDGLSTTANLTTQSNTAVLNIKPIYGVVINADVALAAVAVEQGLERRQQQHERRGLVRLGGLADRFAQARAGLALQVEGEHRQLLHGRAGDQLADAVFRSRRLTLAEGADRPHAGVLQAAGAHGPLRQLAAHRGVVDRQAVAGVEFAAEVQHLREAGGHARADGHALVHQRGQRHLPAVADGAEALAVGDADIGEVYLVEAAPAGGLLDRADLDPRRLHVQEEEAEPHVLRHIGVAAHHDDAEIGQWFRAHPGLASGDERAVAVERRNWIVDDDWPGAIGKTNLGEEAGER